MTSCRAQFRHFLLCLLWLIHAAIAQTSTPLPPLSVDELCQRAGLIFTATVANIEESEHDSVVRITFKVEDGIRGVRSGGEGGTTPAMAAGITEHCWSVRALLSYHVPPPRWTPPKQRGRPSHALKRLMARWGGDHG